MPKQFVRRVLHYAALPFATKCDVLRDLFSSLPPDPGTDRVIDAAAVWLTRAQDRSTYRDGGVARHYSVISGWSSSYPETTGYIIPTVLAYAELRKNDEMRERARRMLDWLVAIQHPDGGFKGGKIDDAAALPVTFNTGQILLGLAAGTQTFGDVYREPMRRAAAWLIQAQDPDGGWRRFLTPYAQAGEKAYETHTAWGLLEAARVDNDSSFGEKGLANMRWALSHQRPNGWFERCCLSNNAEPLTHTLGYVLRGILEGYCYSNDTLFLDAAEKTAKALLSTIRADGFLPGRLNADWQATVPWTCLTGNVQITYCWLRLYEITGNTAYRDAAYRVNQAVRRTVFLDNPNDEARYGAVKGSYPIHGHYGAYEFLNWAAKFCIDANMLENEVRAQATVAK
jgi:hypothetical protein